MDLTDAFEPFLAISARSPANTHAITAHEGLEQINAALDLATAECHTEVLTIQPGGAAPPSSCPSRWSAAPT